MKSIVNAEQIANTASDMIKQLLTFARKDDVQIHPFSYVPFIRDAAKLAQISIPEDVQVDFDCCDEELMIKGDVTQLQQILMNLLNNACDALQDKNHECKRISLKVKAFYPDETFRQRFPGLHAEKYVHMMVADNGIGIPKDQIDKVMEPFFTTKGVGKGTGLGLSMVFSSVQSHGGAADISSTAGEGSTFHVYLPVDASTEQPALQQPEEELRYGKGETILIVDDDPVVRLSGRSVLENLGYNVFDACDGIEAMQIFSKYHEKIDLVMLDIVMPRLGGVQTAEQMRQLKPGIRTIFITSYEIGKFGKHQPAEDELTLAKPYSIHKLSRALHQQLSANRS